MFQNFDLNQDGVIQRSEVRAIIYTLTGLGTGGKHNAQNELNKLIQDRKVIEEKKRIERDKKIEEERQAKLYEEVVEEEQHLVVKAENKQDGANEEEMDESELHTEVED